MKNIDKYLSLLGEEADGLLLTSRYSRHYGAEFDIAEGIAIGKPMRGQEILSLAKKHNVRFVHAPEDKILDARAAIARRGIYCEHTTAANYAAYLEYCRLYGKTPDTLITMCGAGLKSDH